LITELVLSRNNEQKKETAVSTCAVMIKVWCNLHSLLLT